MGNTNNTNDKLTILKQNKFKNKTIIIDSRIGLNLQPWFAHSPQTQNLEFRPNLINITQILGQA